MRGTGRSLGTRCGAEIAGQAGQAGQVEQVGGTVDVWYCLVLYGLSGIVWSFWYCLEPQMLSSAWRTAHAPL